MSEHAREPQEINKHVKVSIIVSYTRPPPGYFLVGCDHFEFSPAQLQATYQILKK
jgi:hypothetical protein